MWIRRLRIENFLTGCAKKKIIFQTKLPQQNRFYVRSTYTDSDRYRDNNCLIRLTGIVVCTVGT